MQISFGSRRRSFAATSSSRGSPRCEQPGGDIYVYGSLSLVRALLTAELLDELVLMIEPITLGGGKMLFPADGAARNFELISAQTAATGVQVCRYRPTR
jgi:dihydrofolate reductase